MATLTEKQENFALEYITNGFIASDAYRSAYDVGENTKETTIWVEAHKILNNSKVSQRVHELRTLKIQTKILTIEERKQLLTALALEGDIKSIDLLNRMENVYVDKVEHSGAIVNRKIVVNPTKVK